MDERVQVLGLYKCWENIRRTKRSAVVFSMLRQVNDLCYLPLESSLAQVYAMFVPGHSGGPAPDLHRVPF